MGAALSLDNEKNANLGIVVASTMALYCSFSVNCQAREFFVAASGPVAAAGANSSAKPGGAGAAKPGTSVAQKSTAYQTGVALYNARRYSEAEQYFTKVVKQEPANSDAFYYLATCQALLGDKPACLRLYKYIVQYFPNTPAAASAAQYVAQNSPADTALSGGGDSQKQLKDALDAVQKMVKKASTAPASIVSIVQVVRARADRPNVSTEAVSAIKQAVDKLPPTVKDVLWANSVKIFVTPTVEDYEPGVKYQEARGYEGGTYKSCPAFYQNRKIVIAERTMDEGDETIKDAFPANQMVNSLYHETGHALDFCLDDISHSDGFKHAYLLDSAHVEPSAAHTLRYYLQKSEDGQEECCAELIGLLLGQTERHTAEMRATFPLTLKFLRTKLGI
jgi:tetratricopeptide (TPR) repeat protein